ncbi:DUF6234 family protein [Streptomyces sp. NPDC001941]|uniref:DUF6234 family protein n=1 Tax=Streptomyces sp. NPDC001941 TaxID=3154659 RepID=UPI0033296CED
MSTEPERRGRGAAVALAAVELLALALIALSWAASYWSWDPQSYGDPPGPYLRKAVFVVAAAVLAAVVAGVRRARTAAVSQLVLALALCGVLVAVKAPAEHVYESSYRDACFAGLGCGEPAPAP